MRHPILSPLLVAAAVAGATPAPAQDVEGLYRPAGSQWSCRPDELGMDGGAVGFVDGKFHGVENTCDVVSMRAKGDWIKVTASCMGEGEAYTDAFALRVTETGLEFDRGGQRFAWERCAPVGNAVGAPRNGRWQGGLGQGWYEASTADDLGNSVIFACNIGGGMPTEMLGAIYFEIGGRRPPPGPVTFVVDGARMTLATREPGAVLIGACPGCASDYNALRARVAAGNRLTVTAADGSGAAFSLDGSRRALGDVVCERY